MLRLRVGLVVAVLLIVWLSAALVRVENQRYAMQTGMCWNGKLKVPDPACVAAAETRTGWYWHIYYALTERVSLERGQRPHVPFAPTPAVYALLFCVAFGIIAIVWLALGFLAGRSRQQNEANPGEAAVRRALVERFPSPAYHLLNNVTLPVEDGTTQVDHVLVSRFGIFVFESKHYSGWLFGDATSPQWTQVLYRNRYRFQNPIHQNHKHVSAVAKLLDFLPSKHIHSVVVFTGDAVFKTERPAGVVSLAELEAYVESFVKTLVLSENRVQFCVGRIECSRMALTKETDVEHVENLRRKFGDAS